VGALAVVDADPVSVEQGIGAYKCLFQQVGAVEVERVYGHPISEGTGALWMSGYRLDCVPLFEEESRDVLTGVASSSCHGVG
jgi:hypothetical protein